MMVPRKIWSERWRSVRHSISGNPAHISRRHGTIQLWTIRFYGTDGDATGAIYGSRDSQSGLFLLGLSPTMDAVDYTIPLSCSADITDTSVVGKAGDALYLDIVYNQYGWNDAAFADGFYHNTNPDGAHPTCGIVTLADQPNYAEATYTETPIEIDGVIDDVWADANTIEVNNYSMGQWCNRYFSDALG